MRQIQNRAYATRERRGDRRRAEPPLTIEIGGREFTTLDWSLSGFRISGFVGGLSVGDEFPVRIAGSVAGRTLEARLTARVVRRAPGSRQLAANYCEFGEGAWEVLEQLSTRRLRGSGAGRARTR